MIFPIIKNMKCDRWWCVPNFVATVINFCCIYVPKKLQLVGRFCCKGIYRDFLLHIMLQPFHFLLSSFSIFATIVESFCYNQKMLKWLAATGYDFLLQPIVKNAIISGQNLLRPFFSAQSTKIKKCYIRVSKSCKYTVNIATI